MAESEKVESKAEQKPIFTFPQSILPNGVEEMIQKQLKPSPTRALVFENDKQRTIGILRKGMSKPGIVSFEILRRAANAVPVARICVNTLKEKITKTKWVIKTIDPLEEPDKAKIDEVTELLKNPNPDETWRSFLDKVIEDLLILDVATIEKTRYQDGTLARLYYVDASTIRPVYDEYGNQDCEVPLPNNEVLPVSFLQIFNNSLYGGPESGEVVAAWPKQDMIRFMQHPQGSLDNFGYGLSAIEGILSVVNNLLSADNYNGSYFDEGSLPPVIMHLAQALEQRQLEAYREYMYQELQGNFHRPAIMAGGGDLKIHSLKDMSNTDMQFMEYTNFLAKLMSAAFGLSPQDIGLTDAVGGKNVAETQKDLSESKGYGSVLNLIEEVINNEILYKDFGYTDLKFEWVAEDSLDPQISATIQDMQLKNGTKTLNEIREMNGDLEYEEWADQPMLLMGEGYVKIHTEDRSESGESSDIADEKVYSSDSKTEKEVKKSLNKSVYTMNGYKTWMDDRGFGQPFICVNILSGTGYVIKPPVAVNLFSGKLECEITQTLAGMGFNVKPVVEKTFADIAMTFPDPSIAFEFDKYINMTPEYDSEKWRSKHGGSRKYPYYMWSEYVDGFPLNSKQIQDDMKRDPLAYSQAIIDLANLYNIEKEMVLGDRRADQYIITPDKRAYGFDYQFKGDQTRWEDSSTAIAKVLIGIPTLYRMFLEKTSSPTVKEETKKSKGLFKAMRELIKSALVAPSPLAVTPEIEFEQNPVMFGALFPEMYKQAVKDLFKTKNSKTIEDNGYFEVSYTYEWNTAVETLRTLILCEGETSGGILAVGDERGTKYCVYYKK